MGLGILPPPGVAPPKAPDVQDFTTSGTWTKPDGARLVLVELIGGGAGGWYGSNSTGGGGGEYTRMTFEADDLDATEPVTVGAGGPGSNTSYSPGGSTTFHGMSALGGGSMGASATRGFGIGGGNGWKNSVVVPSGPGYGAVTTNFTGGTGLAGTAGASSNFGGGGGGTAGGVGGLLAAQFGALQAGNGAGTSAAATAPGGGGGPSSTYAAGAPGAARVTTYF